MKVVFISNYLTHHQKPFSEAMDKLTNGGYRFIQTEPMEDERVNMGWGMNNLPDYVVLNYKGTESDESCKKLIDEADVAIIGSAPDYLVKNRLKQKKLTFYYSERIYKKKRGYLKYPFRLVKNYFRFNRYKNVYMLCASAYTSADYAKTFNFIDKCYKWGYFPEYKKYEDIKAIIEEKEHNTILWCARFIDWKHAEIPIKVAKRLKEEEYSFQLNLIGNGELEDSIKAMIQRESLEDCVHILGTMKPEQVREYMEKSEIYLFTSDRNEGWGAVLNESMNSGCAVVASHAIGSVPFLVKDRENGLIYKDGDLDDVYKKVKWLLDNPEQRVVIGNNAYKTIAEQWNAQNAAERFMILSQELLSGNKKAELFSDGVCSKAEILKDNWYR